MFQYWGIKHSVITTIWVHCYWGIKHSVITTIWVHCYWGGIKHSVMTTIWVHCYWGIKHSVMKPGDNTDCANLIGKLFFLFWTSTFLNVFETKGQWKRNVVTNDEYICVCVFSPHVNAWYNLSKVNYLLNSLSFQIQLGI